jgi:hypothetical protein
MRLENGVYLFDHPYSPGYQIECLCDDCRALSINKSNPTYWFEAGWEPIHKAPPDKHERALQGIASCATQCPCCEMHRQVANRALGYEVVITTDRITPPGLAAGENERCKVTPGCWLIKGHEGHCD